MSFWFFILQRLSRAAISFLDGELERQLRHFRHRRDAVVVVRDRKRREPVVEREELRARDRVLRPRDSRLAVRVAVVDEVDEVVAQVALAVHDEEVRCVELGERA